MSENGMVRFARLLGDDNSLSLLAKHGSVLKQERKELDKNPKLAKPKVRKVSAVPKERPQEVMNAMLRGDREECARLGSNGGKAPRKKKVVIEEEPIIELSPTLQNGTSNLIGRRPGRHYFSAVSKVHQAHEDICPVD